MLPEVANPRVSLISSSFPVGFPGKCCVWTPLTLPVSCCTFLLSSLPHLLTPAAPVGLICLGVVTGGTDASLYH